MPGIQFFGIDNVIEAYENNAVPAFAVWSGKIPLLRYDGVDASGTYTKPTIEEGRQLLENYLSAMYQGSTASYIMKIYSDLKPGEKIKPSTEFDTGFNFKICAPSSEMMNGYPAVRGNNNPVIAALQKIDERLKVIEDGGIEDEEPETITEAVIGMINEPSKLSEFVGSLKEIAELGKSLLTGQPMQPAHIGNIKRPGQTATALDDSQLMRIGNAIELLGKYDPKITEHLERLAQLAEQDTKKFLSIVSMIDLL